MPSPKKTAKCGITRNHRYLNNMTKNNPTNILLLLPIHKVEYATFLHCKFILFQPYVWGVIRGCWYILFLIVLKNCANKKQKYRFCPNFAGPPPTSEKIEIFPIVNCSSASRTFFNSISVHFTCHVDPVSSNKK